MTVSDEMVPICMNPDGRACYSFDEDDRCLCPYIKCDMRRWVAK